MTATATISKWGNGAGILIPKSVREMLGLNIGDKVRFEVNGKKATIELDERPWTLHELMKDYKGPKPEFIDPGQSVGREIW